MRKAVFVVLGVLALTAQAPGDPVMTNYRAYRAALQAGDLAAAESAGRAAWQAANASEPNATRTGVLALNYAKVALANQHREAAHDAAQQAVTLAGSAPGAGLDQLSARLVLGRTELVRGASAQDVGQLLETINAAHGRADLGADALEAANDLGQWALNERHFQIAANSFDQAASFSDMAQGDHDLARGEARTAQGVALVALATSSEVDEWGRGIGVTGSYIRAADQGDAYRQAQAALVQAEEAVFPLAMERPTDNGLTVAQRTYATARAWRTVINARLTSDHQGRLPDPQVNLRVRVTDPRPFCAIRVVEEPQARYPGGSGDHGEFGAVVTRMLINPDGSTRDAQVAAAVPERFGVPVRSVASRWRVERTAESPDDCQMPAVVFYPIMFYIR
jgi:hypothetical protein